MVPRHHHGRLLARSRRARRGASLYLVVLGVSMIVSIIALSSSSIARLQVRSASGALHAEQAELAARSGLEYALNWLNTNPDWRSRLMSGVSAQRINSGIGTVTWLVTDIDGDLEDDLRDHAVLRCEAEFGDAYAAMEVDIEPAGESLTCLEAAMMAGKNIIMESGCSVSGSGLLGANNRIEADTADVNLDAEAASSCDGRTYHGSKTEDVPERTLPGDHVFDWYQKVGTEIKLSDLNETGGFAYIERDLLSRGRNTLGEVNPHGIYWIDCQGASVRILWGRQTGTLVLLNAGKDTSVFDVTLMQADPLNHPVLMVEGNLEIDLSGLLGAQFLNELVLGNLNPAGIPYQGLEDNDVQDNYPARLDGIVYATGQVTITDGSNLRGAIIAGDDLVIDNNVDVAIEHQRYASDYPPPGFSTGVGVRALPYTWRRTAHR